MLLGACDLIDSLLAKRVDINLTIVLDEGARTAGNLIVGICDFALADGSSVDEYLSDLFGETRKYSAAYDGVAAAVNVLFRDVPVGAYTINALIDINANGEKDAFEPFGSKEIALNGETSTSVAIAGAPLTSAPAASFIVQTGFAGNTSAFDASGTTDDDSAAGEIQVRWDFTSDGTWDTVFGVTKTANHTFGTAGTYAVKLQAKDKWGLLGESTRDVVIRGYYLTGFEMVPVLGGSFQMGSATGDADEAPVHTVTLASFKISKYEITQAQYSTVMGREPSHFTGDVARPVERVTWYEAVEFCNELSRLENLDQVYAISGRTPANGYPITGAAVSADWSKGGYRLPTEAEWEFAARGGQQGSTYEFSGSNTAGDIGWYSANSDATTHAVGSKPANELSLYDMSGNVIEWCWDWYSSAYYSSVEAGGPDPTGPSAGVNRVMRGGSWYSSATNTLRSANRESNLPNLIGSNYGFRVARGAVR